MLERARSQDPVAWERLVGLYAPLVFRWCVQAGLQDADAEDVGQEVFRAVARKVAEFRHNSEHGSFRGWLRSIASSKLIDFARAASARGTG